MIINRITLKFFEWTSNRRHDTLDEYYDDAIEGIFAQFGLLSDDIVMEILSYVSYGPLEYPNKSSGTLTQTFPYVSRKFRDICNNSETLWLQALERLLRRDPDRWKPKLLYIVNPIVGKNPPWSSFYDATVDKDDFMIAATIQNMDQSMSKEEMMHLLSKIRLSLAKTITPNKLSNRQQSSHNFTSDYYFSNFNKLLYVNLIAKYKLIDLPIIEISTKIHTLKPFNLSLFGKDQLCTLEALMKAFQERTYTHARQRNSDTGFIPKKIDHASY